jgi:hypothetical protein
MELKRKLPEARQLNPLEPHQGQFSGKPKKGNSYQEEDGARCRVRTCDPYRVKVVLYH